LNPSPIGAVVIAARELHLDDQRGSAESIHHHKVWKERPVAQTCLAQRLVIRARVSRLREESPDWRLPPNLEFQIRTPQLRERRADSWDQPRRDLLKTDLDETIDELESDLKLEESVDLGGRKQPLRDDLAHDCRG